MIVKTVSVHYGRKVNLGDFNSANIECTVWADVEEGEDLHGTMTALWGMAKENVKAQVKPLVKDGNGKGSTDVKEFFLGLPIQQEVSYAHQGTN
jgi:hypothetical protein